MGSQWQPQPVSSSEVSEVDVDEKTSMVGVSNSSEVADDRDRLYREEVEAREAWSR